jgi:monoamine oxidase
MESRTEINDQPGAWERQYQDLGFSPADRAAASHAFALWSEQLLTRPPSSDIAIDAWDTESRWTPYLQAMSGFINGVHMEDLSVRDYTAYDAASSHLDWRLPGGYGSLVTASLPRSARVKLSTSVDSLVFYGDGVEVLTPGGPLRTRAVILTVSTTVLAKGSLKLPSALDRWLEAASRLPLGHNEKLFLEIVGKSPFAPESHVHGNPFDVDTGTFYIRPFGRSIIECFYGGPYARLVSGGSNAMFEQAIDQLDSLFGTDVRRHLRPLAASNWTHMPSIGGAYSHALPGYAEERLTLARPYEDRVFFAGEATHSEDFSTAHGAYQSGLRAADEVIAALHRPD